MNSILIDFFDYIQHIRGKDFEELPFLFSLIRSLF